MDHRRIAEQIDRLENEVQRHTRSYMLDADMASVIDAQLNGHIKAILTYCKLNNLISFADSIHDFSLLTGLQSNFLPVGRHKSGYYRTFRNITRNKTSTHDFNDCRRFFA